jgi:hypothetical protein
MQRAMIMSMGLNPNNMNNNTQRATLLSLGVNVAPRNNYRNIVSLAEKYMQISKPEYTKSNIKSWREAAVQSAMKRAARASPLKRPRENKNNSNAAIGASSQVNNRQNPRNRRVNESNTNYRSYLVKWLRNRNKYFENNNYNVSYLLGLIRKGKYKKRK